MKSILFHFNPRFLLTLSLITGSGELFARNIFKEKPTNHSSQIEIIKEDGSVDRFEKRVQLISGTINSHGLERIKKEMASLPWL